MCLRIESSFRMLGRTAVSWNWSRALELAFHENVPCICEHLPSLSTHYAVFRWWNRCSKAVGRVWNESLVENRSFEGAKPDSRMKVSKECPGKASNARISHSFNPQLCGRASFDSDLERWRDGAMRCQTCNANSTDCWSMRSSDARCQVVAQFAKFSPVPNIESILGFHAQLFFSENACILK